MKKMLDFIKFFGDYMTTNENYCDVTYTPKNDGWYSIKITPIYIDISDIDKKIYLDDIIYHLNECEFITNYKFGASNLHVFSLSIKNPGDEKIKYLFGFAEYVCKFFGVNDFSCSYNAHDDLYVMVFTDLI